MTLQILFVVACIGVFAVVLVMMSPSLNRPCGDCDRDEKKTCRTGCPEYQQWRQEGEWS